MCYYNRQQMFLQVMMEKIQRKYEEYWWWQKVWVIAWNNWLYSASGGAEWMTVAGPMSSRSSYPDEPGAAGRAGTHPRGPSSPIDGGRGADEEKETKNKKKKKKKKTQEDAETEVKVTGKDNNHGRTETSTTQGTAFMGAREYIYLFTFIKYNK